MLRRCALKKIHVSGFPSPALPGSGIWGLISARFASTPNLDCQRLVSLNIHTICAIAKPTYQIATSFEIDCKKSIMKQERFYILKM